MKMRKHGLGVCSKCPTRDICTELCSEADAFADKDKVLQRHELLGNRIYGFQDNSTKLEIFKALKLTPTEEKILRLVYYNIPRNEITEILDISRSSIDWHIFNIKKKAVNITIT